ncbi:hypothetical protein R6Q59_004886 [Mikania micrantha]|uniref:Uncharacterized protein n=1 Tax=Mikania micrantha TaxID=192012 RepID=A0A5N6MPK8_9ASTR|nr:hypothetical protein E3N88_31495 [Mikania micrantha]
MKMIMSRLHTFGMFRQQIHTIISQETIKPSYPTPSHLRTHNLSLADHIAPNVHLPLIFFYKSYKNADINTLKKSLSQTLTQYYPFAGRLHSPSAPHIDCNGEGVEFLEALSDSRLDEFVLNKEQDQTLNQLIPNSLGCAVNKTSPVMVQVQLNRFTCGGAALALSISHKAGDGFTVVNFINHWASVARGGSPINPTFFPSSTSNIQVPEFDFQGINNAKYVTKRFIFHNSKLMELKNLVNGLGMTPINPTRVEVLSSLLFKSAVGATTTISGSFQPSNLYQVVNLRRKILAKLPEITAGNLLSVVMAKMANPDEIKLNVVIAKLRKEIREVKEVKDVEEAGEVLANTLPMMEHDGRNYNFSSLCRFPLYEVDFGWGKPVQVLLQNETLVGRVTHLMDTPSGDGIEATVRLQKEEMDVFQHDNELLEYAQRI